MASLAAGCTAPAGKPKDRPAVYLITSLPLLFGEGFGLDLAKADVIAGIERSARVRPVDLPSQVPPGAALIMAQPRALPAEELVALDAWVRSGGRLVLLADPLLEWPSERPLGDRLRPTVQFADTGLLEHWGLRLDAPEKAGLVRVRDRDGTLLALSPGRLVRIGGNCAVQLQGLVARCALGKGHATVVADADWIDAPRVAQMAGEPVDPALRIRATLGIAEAD